MNLTMVEDPKALQLGMTGRRGQRRPRPEMNYFEHSLFLPGRSGKIGFSGVLLLDDAGYRASAKSGRTTCARLLGFWSR
jgi:hypothetical protein